MTKATEEVGFQPPVRLATIKTRVEKLVKARKRTMNWLYAQSGITKTGYREMWERESVRFTVLQAMAVALKVALAELIAPEEVKSYTVNEPPAHYGKGKKLPMDEWMADVERRLARLEARN